MTTTHVYLCRLHSPPLQQVAKFELTGNSSLYILLPMTNTVEALQALESKMTYAAMQDMIREMRGVTPEAIEVTLPLIKLDHQPNMHLLFKKLGLLVFPCQSDYPLMTHRASLCSSCHLIHSVSAFSPLTTAITQPYVSLPFSSDSQAFQHSSKAPTCAASTPGTGCSWMISDTKPSLR